MSTQKFELFLGCPGNGTTVCNKAVMEGGDYKKVAHISPATDLERIKSLALKSRAEYAQQFENLPELRQYERILDHASIQKLTEIILDPRPISEKLPELRAHFYETE